MPESCPPRAGATAVAVCHDLHRNQIFACRSIAKAIAKYLRVGVLSKARDCRVFPYRVMQNSWKFLAMTYDSASHSPQNAREAST